MNEGVATPMILMVNGATTTVARYAGHPALGRLIQPRSWNRVDMVARAGQPWGAGNDALAGVKPDAYLAMLDAIAQAPRDHLKFVAAPDAVERTSAGIVGSWEGTLWLWRCWRPALHSRGLPGAIVLQDGATPDSVPWDEIAAVFVGASTGWKLSRMAELLVRMARDAGSGPTSAGSIRCRGWPGLRPWEPIASTARSSAAGRSATFRRSYPAWRFVNMSFPRLLVPRPSRLVMIYLLAIAAANLLVSHLGPAIAILNAVCFIGLDLSTRDQLHEQWGGRWLWPRMLALIVTGGALSLLLGGSGRVALASCVAFIAAGSVDTLVYLALGGRARRIKVNGSNLAAAMVDSILFPLLAFGWPISWPIVLGQLGAKVLGGAGWALLLEQSSGVARGEAREARG